MRPGSAGRMIGERGGRVGLEWGDREGEVDRLLAGTRWVVGRAGRVVAGRLGRVRRVPAVGPASFGQPPTMVPKVVGTGEVEGVGEKLAVVPAEEEVEVEEVEDE